MDVSAHHSEPKTIQKFRVGLTWSKSVEDKFKTSIKPVSAAGDERSCDAASIIGHSDRKAVITAAVKESIKPPAAAAETQQ